MLTRSTLQTLLSYRPETGLFIALVKVGRMNTGVVVGTPCRDYLYVKIGQKRYALHRLAFLYITGAMPIGRVDHINMIKSDNRWINLREATHSQNCCNVGRRSNNTSGFKGVFVEKRSGKIFAQIRCEGRQHYLGSFASREEASQAYQRAADKMHREFARVA